MNHKIIIQLGKDLVSLGESLRDTDEKAIMNDIFLDVGLIKDKLNEEMMR